MQHLGLTSFECSYAVPLMPQQFELVFCKETLRCFARFFIFSYKLQMYVLLHIVMMNEHGWIFLPGFAVVLVNEILEDYISHLYMAPSNHTHLDIPNQQDNTSLQQDNDSTKLIFYCRHNKFIQIEQHLNFLFHNTFLWLQKSYIWIVNCLMKYYCIVCTTFPPGLNKYKLHVKATSCHYILSWYTFSTNKWYLICLWYTSTHVCSINRANTVLQKQKNSFRINLNVIQIFFVTFFNYLTT